MPRVWRPPQLETGRLILRAVDETDAPAIFAYASNPNMTRYTLWETHTDLNDSLAFIREYALAHYLDAEPDPLAICLKSNPNWVIGTIGAHWAKRSNRTMEMGFALGEPHWGQGVTAEAARGLLKFLYENYDVERVQAHCFAPNLASARVLQKIGMTFEGCLRSALYLREQFWDLNMYSILRREWQNA